MRKNNLIVIVLVAMGVLIGILLGHYFTANKKTNQSTTETKKPLYWVDSMEPTIHYQKPGKSRMGMALTPVYPDNDKSNDQSTVRISSTVVNNLGVRTVPVIQGPLSKKIETVGYIEPDENRISHIHTYADGWVRKLFVKTVGDVVKKHQIILQLYSPTLVNAQEEYLIALESKDNSLIEASIKRLQAFHISEKQIQHLKKTRKASQLVDVYSHQDGVVTLLNVREGMHVTPNTEMVSLVDLSKIWMIAQIFEKQAGLITLGESARAQLSAYPGKVWQGVVDYIYPQVDPTTRTLKVRFRFDNPDGILKPNMNASITLLGEPKQNILSIPLEALIRSSQGDRVIVALKDGHFQVRNVVVGMESGDRVEILSGLTAGEQVVSSGQFLIDSEANLKTGLQRIEAPLPVNSQAQTPNILTPTIQVGENNAVKASGIVKSVDIKKQTITINHQAIASLGWSAMTMDFPVDKKIDLTQLKSGDHVSFSLVKDAENNYLITQIEILSQ